jgi:uncharacterized protein YkvS
MRTVKVRTNAYDNKVNPVKVGELVKFEGELCRISEVGKYNDNERAVNVTICSVREAYADWTSDLLSVIA